MSGMANPRITILSMMKDEGPRLLEWLAYHRLIGAEEVFVYTNGCRDGTDAMLERLEAMGLVRHLRNDVPAGKKPQPHALGLADRRAEITRAEWLMVIDADEFVHVKTGDGSFAALLAACPEGTDGVAITWRMMGSNGVVDWSDGPLLPQFTRGAPEDFRRGWGVKTLFRPFPHLKLGIHRPTVKGAKRDPARMAALMERRWVNGSGQPMPPSFLRDGWRGSAATVGYALAEVAHFAVQSHEAYLLRGDRGNVNLKADKYDPTYFAIFDRNEVEVPGLAGWSGRVAKLVAEWLRDAELKRLLQASVDWHRARLAVLRDAPGYRDRMDALARAAQVPYAALDRLLFVQPLAPAGKRMVAELQAKGVPDAEIAAHVARSVAGLEATRDTREAEELRAMGITPKTG
jgi:hypothetical protein